MPLNSGSAKMVVILQPGYLPWLGFFDQLYKSDVFVIYDDVQFDKSGWRNRNRIKGVRGIQWLTVPVLTKNQEKPSNKEIKINNKANWRGKHLKSIFQNYSKAPYFKDYFHEIEKILLKDTDSLLELNMSLIYFLSKSLGTNKKIIFSSDLGIKGEGTNRIVSICLHLNATEYLTGDSAKDYLDESLFSENNIKLIYHNYQHPVYRQLYGDFIPYLSVVDLLFNHGKDSLKILTNQIRAVKDE